MKLKICGMKYNSDDVAELRPDYLGYIFWEPSRRYFDGSISGRRSGPKRVGVFVDAAPEDIVLLVYEHCLDAVQLHGKEAPAYCRHLREILGTQHSSGIEIIKAFAVDEGFNFDPLKEYESSCDFFLFDTRDELPGGTGRRFDWRLLKNYELNKPYFLSGGIGLSDAEAIKSFLLQPEAENCYAIDLNSRFEIKPGLKNVKALKSFMKEIGYLSKKD
ncbi:MAG: phosphoribosylanthranilate isomerase [Flavobacteriaceae bacterium]